MQWAAAAAVDAGMKNVDLLLAKKYDKWRREQAKKGSTEPIPQAQAALVALDPRTGEIKAVIGGGDYGESELDHVLGRRQPGSVVKNVGVAPPHDNVGDGAGPASHPAPTIVCAPH